ncbi:glycosyltransferase family 4 protein [Aneurinibacillus sp. UBA3580]|jgi:glycosyltransferase involved in cell wall biosynthesis|uniref:glycosyltransferase family 4 protein n=1 Tax=Aneurinibacillus sp. UBA3580 TaxID=1946041 RepID=UPI00257ED3C9|nr:glycosyltransferase family 4 protein [Aneurinibacillus sp. UBA3580]
MKKKICMLVFNAVTSDPRVTKEAETLSSTYDVLVFGIRNSTFLQNEERVNGYSVCRIDNIRKKIDSTRLNFLTLVRLSLNKVWGLYKLARLAIQTKADVYHAHDFEMLPIAYVASKVNRGRFIYDSHELWVEQRADFPGWFKKIVMLGENFLIKKAEQVITVNESIAEELKKRYSLPEKPAVIHNFTKKVSGPLMVSQFAAEGIRKTIVLYHGGYLKDRGLEEMIESARYLPADVLFRFRGDGPLKEHLQQLAETYIKEGKIEFCPPVPMKELVKEASECDIGIIPYKPTCLNNYYSLPNKLSEYMMAGLAVAASDVPEIRKLNKKVRFGTLFDPYDPKSIAEAIIKLTQDKKMLVESKARAKEWAMTEGNWEEEGRKLVNLYKDLLGEEE